VTEPINLSPSGPPNTVLPELDPVIADRLTLALDAAAFAAVAADHPTCLDAWAGLGEHTEGAGSSTTSAVEAYAYFRIGYHRGLDSLRQNGWRGSGFVRWSEPTNRGFLRCLDGLRRMAEQIDETSEVTRCADFLGQLDPDWPPAGR
jgi:hypothetical protein